MENGKLAFKGLQANGHGNGHSNGNGNGRGVWKNIQAESFNFGIAEGVSMATSLGVVALADLVIPKSIMDPATRALGKVIEPVLDPLEKGMARFCKLEECKVDESESRQVRAERMARTMMIFGSAWWLSVKAKLWTRRHLNKASGIVDNAPAVAKSTSFWGEILPWRVWKTATPQERMIIAADEGVHYGALLALNSPLSGFTDEMIRNTTSILHKTTGMSEQKAHQLAMMAWVWEASNILGLTAGIGAIAGKHKYDWPNGGIGRLLGREPTATHVEKLAHSSTAQHFLGA